MALNVWYLDDEKELCEIFADVFSSVEVVIRTFVDPTEMIEASKSATPDLMFIDFRLPSTNGGEVAKSIDPAIPKVLVTGDIAVQTDYPFLKVFSKPYPYGEIQAVLDAYLKSPKA